MGCVDGCNGCLGAFFGLWRKRPPAISGEGCPEILVNTPGHKVHDAFRQADGREPRIRSLEEVRKSAVSNLRLLQEEVKLQASMDHPHIVRLFETFEDENFIDIVMESCHGGDILSLIEKSGGLTPTDAAHLFRQLMLALSYMHHCQVVHRDIKPENLVLKEPTEQTVLCRANVKLIDFGFARKFGDGQGRLKTICGTPLYVAPEVFTGSYTEKCDIWSSGVTLFQMLCGQPPFKADSVQVILQQSRQGVPKSGTGASEGLVSWMCDLRADARPSAQQVLESSWLSATNERLSNAETSDEIATNLQNFSEMNPLKRACLNAIAHVMEDSDIERLRQTFESLDSGEGTISLDTLRKAISKSADADSICSSLTKDGCREMDYTDWVSANVQPQQYLKEGYCWEAFRIIDKDSSGKISVPELCQVLARHGASRCGGLDEAKCERLVAEFDKNGDGEIDFDEFLDLLGSPSTASDISPVRPFRVKPMRDAP
ncbi:unnamed protein product [Effrenium voratum]|nr:unnamed protein product [Effrenium voratum]